ncbi:MAG: hypothetical protein ABI207_04395 [Crocinitomicaceae bacterium]
MKKTLLILNFCLLLVNFSWGQNINNTILDSSLKVNDVTQYQPRRGEILSIVKSYCEDSLRQDTLTVREQISIGCLFSSDYYTEISKLGDDFIIKHFLQGEHLEKYGSVIDRKLQFEFKVTKDLFMYNIENEYVQCKYNRNKKENFLSYVITSSEFDSDTLYDVHNFSLYSLLCDIRNKTIPKMIFCDGDLKIVQTTKIIETFNVFDTTRNYIDTIISQKLTCTKNGNYISKELLNTLHSTYTLDYESRQIIDSSAIVKIYEYKNSYNRVSYSKMIFGVNYKMSIDYDSNWIAESVTFVKNFKYDNYGCFTSLNLRYPAKNISNPISQYGYEKIFGHQKRIFYNNINNVEALTIRHGRIEKKYTIQRGEKKLLSKNIYYHNKIKKVKRYYDYYNEIDEKTVYVYDKSGQLIEDKTYSKTYSDKLKLIERRTYSYEYDVPY